MAWDPASYAAFADQRSRPFDDLTARIRPEVSPRLVVDLGCGDGPLTLGLARRWPQARVVGVDASPDMLAAARALDVQGRVDWVQARLEDWVPASLGSPIDVLVTNAALQWVPTHRDLLAQWVDALAPGGWIALQVPHNLDAPSHALMRDVAARHPRHAELAPALERSRASGTAAEYLDLLDGCGLLADAWTTTYEHVLPDSGDVHPVLAWVRSTGLRPVLDLLRDDAERDAFTADYERELDAAYPRRDGRVVFAFERVFAVGRRPA